ncbi:polyketide synthase dehydratase domain-containing protein [Wangella sp. NEAU-J3]|nr:polyketide synthase dehydratase domain-containing protein [Jidongwangia harbinensis]
MFPGFEAGDLPDPDELSAGLGVPAPVRASAEPGTVAKPAAILSTGQHFAAALAELGLAPDLLFGHSLGEWSAMINAGYFDAERFIGFVAAQGLDDPDPGDVVSAVVGCDTATASAAAGREVVVSHQNCPHQTVLSGPAEAVRAAVGDLHGRGVPAEMTPFRHGFHTPAAQRYLPSLPGLLAAAPPAPPRLPVWSAATLEPVPDDPAAVEKVAVRQMLDPVLFQDLVERLYDAGVRAFVQVGDGSLTGFVADTLAGCEHLTVAAHSRPRGTMAQLRRLTAGLWTDGLAPRFERLADTAEHGPGEHGPGEHGTAGRIRTTVECSLATMPHLADHAIMRQPPHWPDPSDTFPVVPLAGLVELMCEAARALFPGRVVVGADDVRTQRWLEAEPPTTVTVTAAATGPDRAAVSIDGYATGTVLVAYDYPPAPAGADPELIGQRPPPVAADRLYADGWLFHGPRYAGIAAVEAFADNGVRAELSVRPAPGAVLDGLCQMLGFRTQQYPLESGGGGIPMPVAIGRIRWYGPQPPEGTRLACVGEVRPGGREPTGDAVLRGPDGRTWATVRRLAYRRLDLDERARRHIWAAPERIRLAEPRPGGWFLLRDGWPDPAAREFVMRRYLNAAERAEYAARSTPDRRSWLLGRIVVKDAVRAWLDRAGGGPVYPADVTVGTGPAGRLSVSGPFPVPLDVSLARAATLAVAVVRPRGPGAGPGIGLEPVAGGAVDPADRAPAAAPAATTADDAPTWSARIRAARAAAAAAVLGTPGASSTGVTDLDRTGCTVTGGGARLRVVFDEVDGSGGRYVVARVESPDGAE